MSPKLALWSSFSSLSCNGLALGFLGRLGQSCRPIPHSSYSYRAFCRSWHYRHFRWWNFPGATAVWKRSLSGTAFHTTCSTYSTTARVHPSSATCLSLSNLPRRFELAFRICSRICFSGWAWACWPGSRGHRSPDHKNSWTTLLQNSLAFLDSVISLSYSWNLSFDCLFDPTLLWQCVVWLSTLAFLLWRSYPCWQHSARLRGCQVSCIVQLTYFFQYLKPLPRGSHWSVLPSAFQWQHWWSN